MIEIGKKQTLKIQREVDFGVYLTDGKDEVLLPKKYIPEEAKPGDEVEVFVYKDHMNRPVAVTTMPSGELGDIVGAVVTHTTDFGAFVDIGLEKDVLVPNKEQSKDMVVGRQYAVKLLMDHLTERLIGSTKLGAFMSQDPPDYEAGDEVELIVWHKTTLGFKVIIDQQYVGLLYDNEVYERLEAGDIRVGYIKLVRPDDKIDVTLNRSGYQSVIDSSDQILLALEEEGGTIELGDKSNPEEIKARFNMSKKNFKKILGGLYKAGKININDHQISIKVEGRPEE
jgi:predicted RNA-binding protein (virulence factor B family)